MDNRFHPPDKEQYSEYEDLLQELRQSTFQYFVQEYNPANGLIPDRTAQGAPASITSIGLGLAAFVCGVERDLISREEALGRTLTILRFFAEGSQGPDADAIGHHGFFYHFFDMETGKRAAHSEVSTIDTTFLLAGALTAAAYFDGDAAEEREVRHLADDLYRGADWQWALNGGRTVSHGWTPEDGFLPWRWQGYAEAILLYALGLGSPTHPLPAESYAAWTETYEWRTLYGYDHLYAAPLFIHQLSHVWIDFAGIQDDPMRAHESDYAENSRRATYVQQAYAIDNPRGFKGYGAKAWGITASAGPGDHVIEVDGVERRFYGYLARGVPDGPDDGTLSPWAVVASLPYAPEIVLPTMRNYDETFPEMVHAYGYRCSFNPTFPKDESGGAGWVSSGYYGLNQGPIVLMIENYQSGTLWSLMKQCPYLRRGLIRAGFGGGWLSKGA